MKATGIIRRVDNLGRIVIPKELRNTFDVKESDPLEIFTEDDKIILKKYSPSCIFCGECNDIINYKSKRICKNCLEELKNKL